ncbi:GNAT family N-acetyltransferase [Rhodobacteraceae bacterium KMM 6894]|nr:GNAT family N-acetyltransferase [Rhodobacteraceae bacterium KMM 6894]
MDGAFCRDAAVILRDATPDDVAQILAFWNPQIRDTAITFTTEQKTDAGLRADITTCAAEGRAFLVAERAGRVVGLATWSAFRKGPGYAHTGEHSVVLTAEERGQGTGRALMIALEGRARAAGLHVLIAAVSAENPGAVAFHQALGFVRVGHLPQVGQKFGRWMDLILMHKTL